MPRQNVFQTGFGPPAGNVPRATVRNEAGGKAYEYTPKALATQLAMTSTFRKSFYIEGGVQVTNFLNAIDAVGDLEFIAKLAIYARHKGKMKDAPVAILARMFKLEKDTLGAALGDDTSIAEHIFPFVVDATNMLQKFVMMVRPSRAGQRIPEGQQMMSRLTERRSLGTRMKRVITNRLLSWDPAYVASRKGGNRPSLGDIVKLVHPRPATDEQRALFGYLIDKEPGPETYLYTALPQSIRQLLAFLADPENKPLPERMDIFQYIGQMPEVPAKWFELAQKMSWTQLIKSLNTLGRHKAFEVADAEAWAATKLAERAAILKSRVFPTQMLAAYRAIQPAESRHGWYQPTERKPDAWNPSAMLKGALATALDISVENAPQLPGRSLIGIDCSGSMTFSITGDDGSGDASAVRVVDCAAVFGAALMRQNPDSVVVPYDGQIHPLRWLPSDPCLSLADKIADIGGGATHTQLVFQKANELTNPPDNIIVLSDSEAWVGQGRYGSASMESLARLKQRKPDVKVVCWNLQATPSTLLTGPGVLNIGGWSDALWDVVANFLTSGTVDEVVAAEDVDVWVREVEAIDLNPEALTEFAKACRR